MDAQSYQPHDFPHINMDGGDPVSAETASAPGALRPDETATAVLGQPALNVEADGTPHHKTILPTGAEQCLTCGEDWPCDRANVLGAGDPSFGVLVTQSPEPPAQSQQLSEAELRAVREVLAGRQ